MSILEISEEIIKIQPRGTITIPKSFRDSNFSAGSIVKIKKQKNGITLEPVRVLPYPVRSYTDEEIKEFLAEDAAATARLKKKGLI